MIFSSTGSTAIMKTSIKCSSLERMRFLIGVWFAINLRGVKLLSKMNNFSSSKTKLYKNFSKFIRPWNTVPDSTIQQNNNAVLQCYNLPGNSDSKNVHVQEPYKKFKLRNEYQYDSKYFKYVYLPQYVNQIFLRTCQLCWRQRKLKLFSNYAHPNWRIIEL